MWHTPSGVLAQMVRALACHARGRGFDPLTSRQIMSKDQGYSHPWSFSFLKRAIGQKVCLVLGVTAGGALLFAKKVV